MAHRESKGDPVTTRQVTRLVRVRLHPDDERLVMLDTPPQLAQTMGRFEPARFVGLRGGAYVMPTDMLDHFASFARLHDVLLIDERSSVATDTGSGGRVVGHARPLPECAQCGQPARRDRQPDYCPSCGWTWAAVEHEPYREDEQREQCTRCLARQPFGFEFCQRCGTEIDHAVQPGRVVPVADAPRVQLEDPLPIGAAVDELLQQQIR
jgi:hypothetical protein